MFIRQGGRRRVANGDRGGNIQLIVVAVLAVTILVGWVVVRRYEAAAIASGDASACWTATCRDAVIQRNYDHTTGR